MGHVAEGLEIVRVCRDRYDGRVRNPFNEYECGHWYARAMSSYALLFGLSGARYDAVEKVLYLEPAIKGDFRCFLATDMDLLVLENCILYKAEQPQQDQAARKQYIDTFKLD